MDFFIFPLGEIFGVKSSPAYWYVPAEMRAHMGAVLEYSTSATLLAGAVTLTPEPERKILDALGPVFRVELSRGIAPPFPVSGRQYHCSN